jgi:nicotinate-nucleotide--dimethylbenzimidazole phosphoribosyltransferase
MKREIKLSITRTENDKLRGDVQARLDDLTKPPGSLGRLEELVMQYCLCRGDADAVLEKMKIFTFAGDHGITEEGVSPYPSEVTMQMVMNMAAGGAAISVLCKNAGIDYSVVDIGVAGDLPKVDGIISQKIARGTENFAKGPAMTEEQCFKALQAGIDLAGAEPRDLYGVGEMGIGNTSSASALSALLLEIPAEETVGAGTGASGDLLARKKEVIRGAVDFHRKSWDGSGFDALCRVGGYELAGMAGVMLGAAAMRVPTVVDGFISSAAALAALRICPEVEDYCIFSHASAEHYHRAFLKKLSAEPVMDLRMRLGEGTGSALAMQIIQQGMNCYHQMATFSSAGVSGTED